MSEDGWSDKEIATLRRLWMEGKSASEIGRTLQRTKSSVIGKVHRLRESPRPSPIASEENGKLWTDAHKDILTQMAKAGKRLKIIAAEVGRTEASVASKMRDMGLVIENGRSKNCGTISIPKDRPNAPKPGPKPGQVKGFVFGTKLPHEPVIDTPEIAKRGVPAHECTGCAWINGKCGRVYFMCGEPVAYRSYCASHAAISYVRRAA